MNPSRQPMAISFTVLGTPQPQGSARAFVPKGWTRAVITSANPKMKPWRQEVAGAALQAMGASADLDKPTELPIAIDIEFRFNKPKSAGNKVIRKITRPDVDKLARAVLDALTGIVFKDDAQVVSLTATKEFANGTASGAEGASILVRSL